MGYEEKIAKILAKNQAETGELEKNLLESAQTSLKALSKVQKFRVKEPPHTYHTLEALIFERLCLTLLFIHLAQSQDDTYANRASWVQSLYQLGVRDLSSMWTASYVFEPLKHLEEILALLAIFKGRKEFFETEVQAILAIAPTKYKSPAILLEASPTHSSADASSTDEDSCVNEGDVREQFWQLNDRCAKESFKYIDRALKVLDEFAKLPDNYPEKCQKYFDAIEAKYRLLGSGEDRLDDLRSIKRMFESRQSDIAKGNLGALADLLLQLNTKYHQIGGADFDENRYKLQGKGSRVKRLIRDFFIELGVEPTLKSIFCKSLKAYVEEIEPLKYECADESISETQEATGIGSYLPSFGSLFQ